MVEFLSTSSPPQSKQTLDVWATLTRTGLPTHLHNFVHTALWKKLQTGERQRASKPFDTHCPIDHSLETIAHCMHECTFVEHAFKIIQECFKVDISHIFLTDTIATLTTPAGVVV